MALNPLAANEQITRIVLNPLSAEEEATRMAFNPLSMDEQATRIAFNPLSFDDQATRITRVAGVIPAEPMPIRRARAKSHDECDCDETTQVFYSPFLAAS